MSKEYERNDDIFSERRYFIHEQNLMCIEKQRPGASICKGKKNKKSRN